MDRRIVGLLSAAYVVAFIDRGLLATVAAPLHRDLHLTDTQFGLLSGPAFVLVFCLCGIPLGWLADRTSRRAVIAAGIVAWSVMTALSALATSFGGFFVARLGIGLGEASLVPAALSLIRSAVPAKKLAKAIAVFLMGATVGNVIALVGGGQILAHLGPLLRAGSALSSIAPWRALFLLAAMPGLVLAVFLLRLPVPKRVASAASPGAALRDATRLLGRHRGAFAWLTASTTCLLALSQTPAAWLPLWYVRRYGLETAASATLVGLLFALSAPTGQWLGGVAIDRLRARGFAAAPLLVQAGCALACLPFAWGLCSAGSLAASAASYALFNVLVFAATPAGMTGWQSLTPERAQGLVIALLMAVVTMAGIGVGQGAVGVLSDRGGSLGGSLLAILAVAALVGASCAVLGLSPFTRAHVRVDASCAALAGDTAFAEPHAAAEGA
jgi:MFS family permease